MNEFYKISIYERKIKYPEYKYRCSLWKRTKKKYKSIRRAIQAKIDVINYLANPDNLMTNLYLKENEYLEVVIEHHYR